MAAFRGMSLQALLCVAFLCNSGLGDSDHDRCHGFDEMWGLCPDLPSCEDCTPIDCKFGEWGEWYDSFGHCTGLRFRERSISNVNNECGKPCNGPKIESTQKVAEECLLMPKDCLLSDWAAWTDCESTTGQIYRKRTVVNHPEMGGEPCTGSLHETLPCGQGAEPVPCQFTEWEEWTSCSSTCGVGRHTRMRRILHEAKHSGAACEGLTLETKACSDQECGGHDCVMGAWSQWSMCDLHAHPQRFRHRQVKENAFGTGKRCNQTLKETQGCPPREPEPCRLSQWSEWTALGWREPNPPSCNKECGGGQSFRTRVMQAPPSFGGDCSSNSLRELKACNTLPCRAECELAEWSDWSVCSAQCGTGTMTRKRELADPGMRFNLGCQGNLEEALPCFVSACTKQDCSWSLWSDWTTCTATCGGGLQRRQRAVQALPENGGAACDPLTKDEAMPCSVHPCGEDCVDGAWGEWEDWGACTATCSSAYAVRSRSVEQEPNACGRPAEGARHEYRACAELPSCTSDADCVLSDWSEWGFCSGTCFGVHERDRYIKVYPSGRGLHCNMTSLKESAPCNPGPNEPADEACAAPGPKDCTVSLWSDWTTCSQSCGGGQQERRRKVIQLPQNGGAPCNNGLNQIAPCNEHACQELDCMDCIWAEWSDWGDCTDCHGQRYRHRAIAQMPNHCGKPCDLQNVKEVSACTGHCKEELYCTWTEWSAATGCGVGCGPGMEMRSRALSLTTKSLDSLFPTERGGKCQGAQLNLSSCEANQPCTPPCIPTDCEFGAWGAWSLPTTAGLCERRRGIALINNECGMPCTGTLSETKPCVEPNKDRRDCLVSDWSSWGACEMNGKVGQRQRQRAVVQQPTFDGEPCMGTLHETIACVAHVPIDCALAQWGEWTECERSCGGGLQHRKRQIARQAQHGGLLCEDNLAEMRTCNVQACLFDRKDCAYGDWSEWTGCGVHGQRYRERAIAEFSEGGGELCEGDMEETEPCEEEDKVDCVVSDWTSWDGCDATCGGGQMRRQRQIMVFPTVHGQVCPEELIQTTGCNTVPCSSNDCLVADWQAWSTCTASCGVGHKQRAREVLRQRDAEGVGCSNDLAEIAMCELMPCPQDDCQWGDWEAWSACSCSCGGGQQNRVRHIAKSPSIGGRFCEAQNKAEVRPCNEAACQMNLECKDALWGDWAEWSPCSASCEGGVSFRSRQLVQMADECGKPVAGDSRETQICNANVPCEASTDCVFGDWGVWSACSQTCHGVMRRSRVINQYGAGKGAFCEGHLKEVSSCNPEPGATFNPCDAEAKPAIHCLLAQWSDWGACSVSCGGGEHTRHREIMREASHGGEPCTGSLTSARQCSTNACVGPAPVDCEFGNWQDWGACDKCGGQRTRFRHITTLPKHGGQPCEPFDAEEASPCPRQCGQEYCAWGDWAQWGECTAKCGTGKRMRRRYLGLEFQGAPALPEVQELVEIYSELKLQAKNLEDNRIRELLTAFSVGFFSFIAGLAGLRAFAWQRRKVDTRAASVGRNSELAATEVPLVRMA